jgi:hypothetical protein
MLYECNNWHVRCNGADGNMLNFVARGLVIRVPGYRSRGSGFDSWHYQFFIVIVGLEQDQLSLVRIIEQLLE